MDAVLEYLAARGHRVRGDPQANSRGVTSDALNQAMGELWLQEFRRAFRRMIELDEGGMVGALREYEKQARDALTFARFWLPPPIPPCRGRCGSSGVETDGRPSRVMIDP